MSSKNSELSEVTEISELEEVTQPQAQGEDIVNNAQSESIISKELHAASSSHLKFPDGELVDEELLGSNPPDADKVHLLFFTIKCCLFIHACMYNLLLSSSGEFLDLPKTP